MTTVDTALDAAQDIVARALRAEADACDVVWSADASVQVDVRLGQLEDLSRSESAEIALRVFVGQRHASSTTTQTSPAALTDFVARVVAMAREVPEDRFAGLAPQDRLLHGPALDLDLDDGREIAPETLRAMARTAENAARQIAGVTNSEGGSASASRSLFALATSHGFAGGYAGTRYGLSAVALAGEGSAMQRDYHAHQACYLDDVEPADTIGAQAGRRAVARLNPRQLPSGPMPIVFSPRVSQSLLGHLLGAISGPAIARKTSFLRDALGQPICGRTIQIIDDPHRRRGLRSRPFDGEGLPTAPCTIVADGVLTSFLIDSTSGRQLNMPPTGHATYGGGASASNLYLAAGTMTPDVLMADIKTGLFVTELIGMGVNGLTGDYSRGASGFAIRDGALDHAVNEVTIAGNLRDMLMAMTPADDLVFRYGINAPTVRIDGMTLAGA